VPIITPSAFLGRCSSLPLRERIGVPFVLVFLLFSAGFGIDAIIHPSRHVKGYRGGEILRDWRETGAQFAGIVFCYASAWMLYKVIRSVWSDCFR
jgi:hypothetical protein